MLEAKNCGQCKEEKFLGEFNFRNKKNDTRQKSCRNCTRSQIRRHYSKNREYYLNKARKRNKQVRTEIKEYVWNYFLAHPCVDCGEADPIVLDFDHQGDKIDNVSDLVRKKNSFNSVKAEIEKCLVRCANCHRRKTAKDFAWYVGRPL